MTNITTKEELIRQLECTKHTFHITTYGIMHLWNSFIYNQTIPNFCIVAENEMEECAYGCEEYLKFYDKFDDKNKVFLTNIQDAFRSAERTYIRETFEWINDYVQNEINGETQEKIFQEQSWYRMLKILRNCVSHNWIIKEFNTHEKKYIKENGAISYYGVDIVLDDQGKTPYSLGWSRFKTMKLCDEILQFSHLLK